MVGGGFLIDFVNGTVDIKCSLCSNACSVIKSLRCLQLVTPKKFTSALWTLFLRRTNPTNGVDLSLPEGGSINNGIAPELSDHLSALVVSAGRGSFMVKADIKEAYRMVPVHPEDQHLLGVRWGSFIFIDKVLPFGLRSAPKLFSALADAIQWILHSKGIKNSLHYLNDFILVANYQPAIYNPPERVVSSHLPESGCPPLKSLS